MTDKKADLRKFIDRYKRTLNKLAGVGRVVTRTCPDCSFEIDTWDEHPHSCPVTPDLEPGDTIVVAGTRARIERVEGDARSGYTVILGPLEQNPL